MTKQLNYIKLKLQVYQKDYLKIWTSETRPTLFSLYNYEEYKLPFFPRFAKKLVISAGLSAAGLFPAINYQIKRTWLLLIVLVTT